MAGSLGHCPPVGHSFARSERESLPSLRIILLAVAACVGYGVIHDQFTARICVEYFTIGHDNRFGTDDPTLLALGWGVIATWWVGAILGAPLAAAARAGQAPKWTATQLVRPTFVLMAAAACLAALAGVAGSIAAAKGWVHLVGPLAERVPPEKHAAFLTDLWIHNASYAAGFFGGMVLIVWVWRRRRRELNV